MGTTSHGQLTMLDTWQCDWGTAFLILIFININLNWNKHMWLWHQVIEARTCSHVCIWIISISDKSIGPGSSHYLINRSGVSGDKKSPLSIHIFNIWLVYHVCNDIISIALTSENSNRKVEEVLKWALGFFLEMEVGVTHEGAWRAQGPWSSCRDSGVWVRGWRAGKGLSNHKGRNPRHSWRPALMRDRSRKAEWFLTMVRVPTLSQIIRLFPRHM